MIKGYICFGLIIIATLAYFEYTGWSPTSTFEDKVDPQAVMRNPSGFGNPFHK
jgi:hypothetical protein